MWVLNLVFPPARPYHCALLIRPLVFLWKRKMASLSSPHLVPRGLGSFCLPWLSTTPGPMTLHDGTGHMQVPTGCPLVPHTLAVFVYFDELPARGCPVTYLAPPVTRSACHL